MGLSRQRTLLLLSVAMLASAAAGFAVAGPNGGTVVGGSATIQGQGSAAVTINQSSQNAIINWQTLQYRQRARPPPSISPTAPRPRSTA